MNALLSLPHISKSVARSLLHQKSAPLIQVRQDTRRRAKRALAYALSNGTLEPTAVTQAIAEGELALAQLMLQHSATLCLPAIHPQNFLEHSPEPFAPADIPQTKELLRQLLTAQIITPKQVKWLVDSGFDKQAVTKILNDAFNTISERINQSLVDAGLVDVTIHQPLAVCYSENRLHIEIAEAFVMPPIANPETDPLFWAAYQDALQQVASSNAFITPLTDGLEEVEAMLCEVIDDIQLHCGDLTETQQIDPELLQRFDEEFGFDPEFLNNTVPSYLALKNIIKNIPALTVATPEYQAWLETASPQQVQLITQLHKIAQFQTTQAKELPYSMDSDCYFPYLMFLNSHHPYIDLIIEQTSQMAFNEGMNTTINHQNPSQILSGIEDVLMQVALANTIFSQVLHYEQSS